MSELIVIEQTNAVAVLSTDKGIETLLSNVRANIDSMDGGSMKNKTSRKKIRSNAYQATIAYKDINEKTIEPLIADLTKKIQPQLDVINAVKANQSVLQSGLQQIRKDVNQEVDEYEAKIQKEIDDQAWLVTLDEASAMNILFDKDRENQKLMAHMDAINTNHEFDKQKAEAIKLAEYNAEQDRIERIARDKAIAERAAAEAKLKAEQDAAAEKQRLIDEAEQAKVNAENQRKAAIQAERDAEIAEQNRIEAIEQAKQEAIKATALLEKQQAENEAKRLAQEKENKRLADEAEQRRIKEKADAEALAEKLRLAAIEQTKIDEANKVAAQKLADDEAEATRKANVKHSNGIKKAIIASLMEHAGLSKEDATATASALWYGKIKNINVIV